MSKNAFTILVLFFTIILCCSSANAQMNIKFVDRNGDIVVIDDRNVSVHCLDTMELLWQATFEGTEYQVSPFVDQSTISFITKSNDAFLLYYVNAEDKKLECFCLADQPVGPVYFVQDGVIYKNRQGTVLKYSFVRGDSYSFSFSEQVIDIYNAVSSPDMDYIIYSAESNESRMVLVSAFSKSNEHVFTTNLYDSKLVKAALCEAITIDNNLIITFYPQRRTDNSVPILWVSENGEVFHKELIENKDCSVHLRKDGSTKKLYVFINVNMDPTIILQTYNQYGQFLNEQSIERYYPFSAYYYVGNTWYMWDEERVNLIPMF